MPKKLTNESWITRSVLKKNHRAKLKEFRSQALTIEGESHRNTMLKIIDLHVEEIRTTRFKTVYEMIDHVISTEKFIKRGIFHGLYGPMDCRTRRAEEELADYAEPDQYREA